MDFNAKLKKFSELVVKMGVNIQNGEELYIQSPIECAPLARLVAEEAYKAGAKLVEIDYNDEHFAKTKYKYTATDVLCDIPAWNAHVR